ncbi:CO-responsive transcriptional regulator RcoM [Pseudovibrio axinellae]|uniref:CO-responsive transcriptional regulator RcoM n=1 Tax=Pseudovibrio axinellae TaxID=989403 RepID=A0A165T417_9HYPH|nr:MHYT domain-containing protein [Pseudovibrio axinellae]KZL05403.1 CO-responsive transcriptional regulator RcoM [Pseudovibrio axinellae]SEQ00725.1 MHYT domain-containing protein, NO-binding membrane sensor [Pseudovibrio axinellae]
MLTYTYNLPLVAASVLVAILAAFSGMALTNGLSRLPSTKRKLLIAMAACIIGGGIWSMHFVALLALNLPVSVSYDLIWTIGSVLVEILMSGTALLILHFGKRNWVNMGLAGAILGYGVVTMHFVGMFSIRGCLPVYGAGAKILPILVGPATGILAVWAAYSNRTKMNILLGSILFGLSVSVIHYVTMYWTGFAILPAQMSIDYSLDDSTLALWVLFSAFGICALFLFTSATFLEPKAMPETKEIDEQPDRESQIEAHEPAPSSHHAEEAPSSIPSEIRIPYEKDNSLRFLHSNDVAVIQAEGHYSILYTTNETLFCPWSISNAAEQMPDNFIRTHRSYIVNLDHVSGFARNKDNGKCTFDALANLSNVPISRSRIDTVKNALGL